METIERTVAATREQVWELWTTPAGIEQWWAPEGFVTEVEQLELTEGGALVYTMTATAPAQVAFMKDNGLPLSSRSRKTFTEIRRPERLAYTSYVDFVPDHEPYDHLTVVDLSPVEGGTRVVMTIEPMHDPVWTERLLGGRTNELDNLVELAAARRAD